MVGQVVSCGDWFGPGGASFGPESAPGSAVVTGLALLPTSPVIKPWAPGSQPCPMFKKCPPGQSCRRPHPGADKVCGAAPPAVPGGCQILGFFWTDALALAAYASRQTKTPPASYFLQLIPGSARDSVQVHAPSDSALSRVVVSARTEDGACSQLRLYARAFRRGAGPDSPLGGAYPPQATPNQKEAAGSLGCPSGQPTTYISGIQGELTPNGPELPPSLGALSLVGTDFADILAPPGDPVKCCTGRLSAHCGTGLTPPSATCDAVMRKHCAGKDPRAAPECGCVSSPLAGRSAGYPQCYDARCRRHAAYRPTTQDPAVCSGLRGLPLDCATWSALGSGAYAASGLEPLAACLGGGGDGATRLLGFFLVVALVLTGVALAARGGRKRAPPPPPLGEGLPPLPPG
jgi:hypothetical protein